MVAGFLEGARWASEWKPCGLPVPALGIAHEMTWCSLVYEANSSVAPGPCCLNLPPLGPELPPQPQLQVPFRKMSCLAGEGPESGVLCPFPMPVLPAPASGPSDFWEVNDTHGERCVLFNCTRENNTDLTVTPTVTSPLKASGPGAWCFQAVA